MFDRIKTKLDENRKEIVAATIGGATTAVVIGICHVTKQYSLHQRVNADIAAKGFHEMVGNGYTVNVTKTK